MLMSKRTIEVFEEMLIDTLNKYNEGECSLDDVLIMADKLQSYKSNVGIDKRRIENNPREKAFYEQWLYENAPIAGINSGHGILQDLFIETGLSLFDRRVIEVISERDRMIVATVIQWLGSNVGMAFLSESLKRFGASITYQK